MPSTKFVSRPDLCFWFCVLFIVALAMPQVLIGLSGSLTLDEPYSVNLVNLSWAGMSKIFRQETPAPLYYYLLKLWTELCGDSETAVRSLSVLCFVATVVIVGVTAKKIGGLWAGIAAAALASTSQVGLIFADTARPYALLSSLVAASGLVFLHVVGLVSRPRLSDGPGAAACLPGSASGTGRCGGGNVFSLAGLVILSALGLLTHPIFIFFMLACSCAAWLSSQRAFWMVTVCNALGVALYLAIWGSYLFGMMGLPTTAWMTKPGVGDLLDGYLYLWGETMTFVVAAFVLISSLMHWSSARTFLVSRLGLVLVTMLMVSSLSPFAVSQYKSVFLAARTPSIFFPVACVAVALLVSRFNRVWMTAAMLATVLGVSFIGAFFDMAGAEPEESPRASIRYVVENAKGGDILISGGLSINEVTYYLHRLNAPGGLRHEVFPAVMREHPGWMDPPSLLANSGELAAEAAALVKQSNESLAAGNRVWFFYEIDMPSREVLDILKNQLDRGMVLIRQDDRAGSFFDAVLVYAPKKEASSP